MKVSLLTSVLACSAIAWATAAELKLDSYGDPLPEGAVMRLGTERFRHHGWHQSIAFLPDGKSIVSFSNNVSLNLFDAESGKALARTFVDNEGILDLAASPDGKRIITVEVIRDGGEFARQGVIRLRDSKTLKEIKTIRLPNKAQAKKVAVLPDGKAAAVVDESGVRLWDLEGVEELPSHSESGVESIAVSPDGSLIAIGGSSILLWDWKATKESRRIVGSARRSPKSLAFSPDGKSLAIADDHPGGVSLWDLETNKQRLKLPHDRTQFARKLAFTPDGERLLTVGYSTIESGVLVWDAQSGDLVKELPLKGELADAVAVSKDGTKVAGSSWSTIHVWDAKTWKEFSVEDNSHRGAFRTISSSSDGLLATGGQDHTLRLWNLKDGRFLRKFDFGYWVAAVAVSADGKLVAGIGNHNEFRVWESASGKLLYDLPGHGRGNFYTVRFVDDDKKLISFGEDFNLRVIDLKTGKAIVEHAIRPSDFKFIDRETADSRELLELMMRMPQSSISPDGKWFALHVAESFRIYQVESGKEKSIIPFKGAVRMGFEISNDSRQLFAILDGGLKEGVVRAWKIETGELTYSRKTPERVSAAAFAPDGKHYAIATGGLQPMIRLFSTEDEKPIWSYDLPAPAGLRSSFTADGKQIVCALRDGSVLIYDVFPAKK